MESMSNTPEVVALAQQFNAGLAARALKRWQNGGDVHRRRRLDAEAAQRRRDTIQFLRDMADLYEERRMLSLHEAAEQATYPELFAGFTCT